MSVKRKDVQDIVQAIGGKENVDTATHCVTRLRLVLKDDNKVNKERHLAALSFLTFVALDENGKPTRIPKVYPETKIEKWFYEGAPKRVQRRKERREDSKRTIEFLSEAQHIENI